jgi:hypothetical protein
MKYPSGSRTIRTRRFPNRTGTPFGVTNERRIFDRLDGRIDVRVCMTIIGTPRSKTRDSTGGLLLLPSTEEFEHEIELDTVNVCS